MASDLPVAALELIHADDDAEEAWGLAGIEGEGIGQVVYLPHYDVSPRWWTRLALVNPCACNNPFWIHAFGNDGRFAGSFDATFLPRILIESDVDELF